MLSALLLVLWEYFGNIGKSALRLNRQTDKLKVLSINFGSLCRVNPKPTKLRVFVFSQTIVFFSIYGK